MKSLFLFDNGGSLTLSRKRAYYASQSDENPDGYANSREQAERLYQLKEDWSQAINNLVKKEITDYDGKEKYNLDELDKNNDGYIDLITIIYKHLLYGIIVIKQILLKFKPTRKLFKAVRMFK